MSRRTLLLQRFLIVCAVSGAYGLGLSHAQDTGEPVPVRIVPLTDYLPALDTDRESVRADIEWICGVMFGQPQVLPSDCRVPHHGRTMDGGEGPENDSAEETP